MTATFTESDPIWVRQNLELGQDRIATIPTAYRGARLEVLELRAWVDSLVTGAVGIGPDLCPRIAVEGPSVLLIGPTGVGKTSNAYAALRALSESGARCRWTAVTAAGFFDRLSPRSGVDPVAEFEVFAHAHVLLLDDVGSQKTSEWREDKIVQLLEHRNSWRRPTLITTNIPRGEIRATLGDRVASRLAEMATRVVLTGRDRRYAT